MRRLRKIRVALAVCALLALTAAFVDFTGRAAGWFGWLTRAQLAAGALALSFATVGAILTVTLLFGRVYCSVVCPLGIFQDVLVFLRRLCGFRFAAAAETKAARRAREGVRLAVAAVAVGGGLLGLHFQWLEPYAIYGRAASALAAPLWRLGNNALAQVAERMGGYAFHAVEVALPPVAALVVAAGTLALVAALALWKGRLWCNAVCPVGTLLGYTAKFARVKVRIDAAKCVKCGLCARACKAGSIEVAKGTIDGTTCVTCFDCGAVCGKEAITWSK